MANSTITATIALSGAGMTSQTLAVGKAVVLPITSPTIESGAEIVPKLAAPVVYATLVDGTTIGASDGYVYIKNTETTTSAKVKIYNAAIIGSLKPGEWGFFPVAAGSVIKVTTDSATDTSCEFGYWSAA